jgi:hypothetical protein
MVIGRITRVDGIRAAAVFFERMQPHLVSRGIVNSAPRINSFVETGVGFDKVVCQIVGEHEAEYDKRNEVNQAEHVIPDGGFVVDLEVRGHITGGKFLGGLRCLPIVGATVETIEDKNLELLYSSNGSKPMPIGHSLFDETQTVYLDMGKLIASHIGIFGNTGSGKSNTLACIMNKYLRNVPNGSDKARVIIFDLNNEYGGDAVIEAKCKKVYHLNTRKQGGGDRIPIDLNNLDVDSWGTILRATQKTQMPVVRRAFRRWKEYAADGMVDEIMQSLLDKRNILFFTLRNYCAGYISGIDGLAFNNKNPGFYYLGTNRYINGSEDISLISISNDLSSLQRFYLCLAFEVSRAAESGTNFDYVQPLLPRAKAVVRDLEKLFEHREDFDLSGVFDGRSCVVIQLGDVNESSREMLPSLLSELVMKDAEEIKGDGRPKRITTIVIDEAHNLLGYDDSKSDLVHDNTLRVFERVIKEGRKFGVFLCIASQRPSDISATITSQIHNYFIHKLVNPNDIDRIRRTVSFMGEGSLSMLSALGQGECIISGPSLYMPQYAYIERLDGRNQPNSSDIRLFGEDGLLDEGPFDSECPF